MTFILSSFSWIFVTMVGLTLLQFVTNSVTQVKKLHQIPCSRCQFFTQTPCLKCTVQPQIAATELAIGCPDFEGVHLE